MHHGPITKQKLELLAQLLEQWHISRDQWYVTGEHAFALAGYTFKLRPGQVDILVMRSAWPWKRSYHQRSLLPDKGSTADRQLHQLSKKIGLVPDFHPLPHEDIRANSRFVDTFKLKTKSGYIRILKPSAGVLHRKLICDRLARSGRWKNFDVEKFERWKQFIEMIQRQAKKRKARDVLTTTHQTLTSIEGVIQKLNPSIKSLGGQTAFPGTARGTVWLLTSNPKTMPAKSILVCQQLLPRHLSLVRKAAAVIAEHGGIMSHAAILAREMNIPCIVGLRNASKLFKNNERVEIDAKQGVVRKV